MVNNGNAQKKSDRETWVVELVAEGSLCWWLVPAVPWLINVIILDCSWRWVIAGGNSLIIHSTKAEGSKDPKEKIRRTDYKDAILEGEGGGTQPEYSAL